MQVDLHTHTSASDGKLTAIELIERAKLHRVNVLSITDHDTTAAYETLQEADYQDIDLIPGIEFSTSWRKLGVHVVGLNINLHSSALQQGISFQKKARQERNKSIAERLVKKLDIPNPLHEIQTQIDNDNIGRPHFAQFLVQLGIVSDTVEAFDRFLGIGKLGDIKHHWAALPDIIEWIRAAGGTAVLAHPLKYKLTRSKLLELVEDFKQHGGEAIEVVNGQQRPDVTRDLERICEIKSLHASCGSDFHQPAQSWSELGQFPSLPANCKPVWDLWD